MNTSTKVNYYWMSVHGFPATLVKPDLLKILRIHLGKNQFWLFETEESDGPDLKTAYVALFDKTSVNFFLKTLNSSITYNNKLIHLTADIEPTDDTNMPLALKHSNEHSNKFELFQSMVLKKLVQDVGQYTLPQFGFISIITKQMENAIIKHNMSKSMENYFNRRLKNRLRFRFMQLLVERDLKTYQAIKLYREKYPPKSDGKLVLCILDEIRDSMFSMKNLPGVSKAARKMVSKDILKLKTEDDCHMNDVIEGLPDEFNDSTETFDLNAAVHDNFSNFYDDIG